MPTQADLIGLRERVLAATGHDPDLDKRIFGAFWGWSYPLVGSAWIDFTNHLPGSYFTGSIDDALALAEDEMPGHRAGFQPCIGTRARGHIIAVTEVSAHHVAEATAATAPLAILAAFLTAKIALLDKDQTHAE